MMVDLDTEEVGIFKIDDNMPEELKQQLTKFNQKSQNLNNIISGNDSELNSYDAQLNSAAATDDIDDTEELDDGSEEETTDDIIEEDDDVEVGNLF